MGMFLNNSLPYEEYKNISRIRFFVDKSRLIDDIISSVTVDGQRYFCITRPRRFGKSVMANMLGAFFGRGFDGRLLFDRLAIAQSDNYLRHLNSYDVVYMDFSRIPRDCKSYEQYISRIQDGLNSDLREAYQDLNIDIREAVWDNFHKVFEKMQCKFIFVIDEWDALFHADFVTEDDKRSYLVFLRNLLKGQAYVEFAYMTGILPITKYSSGSEINMFREYNMATSEMYSEYFGFLDSEVDGLFDIYRRTSKNPKITREDLRIWYDGYDTVSGKRLYNPRSIVCALTDNQLGSYWTNSGPYDEIFFYIKNNVEDIRDDLMLMVSGERIEARVREYAATASELNTRDQIYSAMVVYGLLTYDADRGEVFIPNRELMDKFNELLLSKDSLGYMNNLARESEKMLKENNRMEIEMARTIRIGGQDFEKIRVNNNFYIDKTDFIRQWWEADDDVTLITRPRRFGKTLNMSMLEQFFSVKYAGRGELFEGLSIWKEEKYRQMQGTWPVISISFAWVKENSFKEARRSICRIIEEQYNKNEYLLHGDLLNEKEKAFYQEVTADMPDSTAAVSLRSMADFLGRYHGKKTIILLDEYDTPMQEAYVHGYWEEMVSFTRSLFNSTFKTNPYLERAVMTGITRGSKESIFSDLNNLEVVTTTSNKYADAFGFTEQEVFAVLDEFGLSDQRQRVKEWYDGFSFGSRRDIYNPWSIINYLDKKKAGAYWANTSANSLVEKLIREGRANIKQDFEELLHDGTICMEIDEQIVYNQLLAKKNAVWSLLLASGYLKVVNTVFVEEKGRTYYDLALTNKEVKIMFENMIQDWFSGNDDYNDFIKALLLDDVDAMNEYMNRVAFETFSYFDTGKNPVRSEPEKFYHGFVLGLMVELIDRYVLTSNRESGFGRYDVMLEPKNVEDDAMILEFKVFQPRKEQKLEDTVAAALQQIEEKKYAEELVKKGIPAEKIREYGFAFCGKEVLIGRKE